MILRPSRNASLFANDHFLTRYAHLFDDPLRAATERVGAIVTGTGTKQPADVITFNRR
jgi:hypothetical protein